MSALNLVLLASAVVPVVIVVVGSWLFLRAGRRHDEQPSVTVGPERPLKETNDGHAEEAQVGIETERGHPARWG